VKSETGVRLPSGGLASEKNGERRCLAVGRRRPTPLVRDGEEQPYQIDETPTQFAIQWQAEFSWNGGIFVVRDRAGAIRRIAGYPAAEIRQALQWAIKQAGGRETGG